MHAFTPLQYIIDKATYITKQCITLYFQEHCELQKYFHWTKGTNDLKCSTLRWEVRCIFILLLFWNYDNHHRSFPVTGWGLIDGKDTTQRELKYPGSIL